MNKKWNGGERRQSLRSEAESMLFNLSPDELKAQPNEILLHELMVHKVELEMQNEELRKTHLAMEEARDRYWHLYEFSPIGYITVSRETMVSEINLTGCSMLGVNRSKILNRRFQNFVAPRDQDRWHRLFMAMMNNTENEKQAFDLEMQHEDGSLFHGHLDCIRLKIEDAEPLLRISLTDISNLKQSEIDLRIAAIVFESKEPMMVTDADTVILRVNKAFINNCGYSLKEVTGQKPNFLKSSQHKADFYSAIWETINSTGSWEGVILNKHKNGEIHPESTHITAVKNDAGEIKNYVVVTSI